MGNKKVALVVGHSKIRQGAKNKKYGITEWEYNKNLVAVIEKNLRKLYNFEELEIRVYFRKYDIFRPIRNLVKRIFSNDLTIFFHCNAFNQKISGCEMLIPNVGNYELVDIEKINKLNEDISLIFGIKDRGIKYINRGERGAYQLWETDTSLAIMAESFFLDNNNDYEKFASYDNISVLAKIYVKFIVSVLGGENETL
jgi:N-acetylmuramoyl-L-alanine amidase